MTKSRKEKSKPDNIGDEPPMSDKEREVRQRLDELAEKIHQILVSEPEFSVLVTIAHDETGYTLHVGSGCPVCQVQRSFMWLVENQIVHTGHIAGEGDNQFLKVVVVSPGSNKIN